MATPTSRFDRILRLFQESFHLSHADALKATVEFEKIIDEGKNKSEKAKSIFFFHNFRSGYSLDTFLFIMGGYLWWIDS